VTTIKRLRELLAEATPGSWAVKDGWSLLIVRSSRRHLLLGGASDARDDTARFVHPIASVRCDGKFEGWEAFTGRQFDPAQAESTAALIVEAVNALPGLLDVAEAARALAAVHEALHRRGDPEWKGWECDERNALCAALARLDGAS